MDKFFDTQDPESKATEAFSATQIEVSRERGQSVRKQYANIEPIAQTFTDQIIQISKDYQEANNKERVSWGNQYLWLPESLACAFHVNDQFDQLQALTNDWDGEGSAAPAKDLLGPAWKFLMTCAHDTFKSDIHRPILHLPVVSLCFDGSVDISWRTQDANFLVNIRIKNGQLRAYYYGETSDTVPFGESWIFADRKLPNHFVAWLKNIAN